MQESGEDEPSRGRDGHLGGLGLASQGLTTYLVLSKETLHAGSQGIHASTWRFTAD